MINLHKEVEARRKIRTAALPLTRSRGGTATVRNTRQNIGVGAFLIVFDCPCVLGFGAYAPDVKVFWKAEVYTFILRSCFVSKLFLSHFTGVASTIVKNCFRSVRYTSFPRQMRNEHWLV